MFPNDADSEGYQYPTDGKLPIRGVVPLDKIFHPKHLDANDDPAMVVVKNGTTTGTTAGWVSGLKSLVRYYKHTERTPDHASIDRLHVRLFWRFNSRGPFLSLVAPVI